MAATDKNVLIINF